MGFFDLICPPRVSPGRGDPPWSPGPPHGAAPTDASCQNCHESRPVESECPALEDWPPGLDRPIDSITREPEAFRWWMDENRLRTTLRRRIRQEIFPFEVGAHTLRIEADPNERQIDSWFITDETRATMNLRGEGMGLFLNTDPLLEGRHIRLIPSLRIFFTEEEPTLTSSSWLSWMTNWFAPPHDLVLQSIPVAYDPETGRTYGYTEYTRLALIASQNGLPTRISRETSPMDGGVPLPLSSDAQTLDGGPVLDLPPEILEEMRRSAPHLGTGYADAGCCYFEALPVRLPYLFEFAHHWATHRTAATRIDLLRVYRDIQTLQRLSARHPSPGSGSDPLSFLDSARIEWNLRPQRLAFENFLLEFDPTIEHSAPDLEAQMRDQVQDVISTTTERPPITLTIELRNSGLHSVQIDDQIHLSRLFVPGWIHLGPTSFHLRGTGPDLNVQADQWDAEIRPFDVGQSDPAERGLFHVAGGHVRDGEEIREGTLHVSPGIHVEGNPEHSLDYSVNLHVELRFEMDGESYDVSANLVAVGRLLRHGSGFEPEVGSTAISLRNLSLTPHGRASSDNPVRPLIEHATLTISDAPNLRDLRTGFHVQLNVPDGSLPFFRGGNVETFIPIGAFDPESGRNIDRFTGLLAWMRGLFYRTDHFLDNFHTALNFQLSGRNRVPDARGELQFSTHLLDSGVRTYEALLEAGPLGFPIDEGLSLYLNPIHARFQATQETADDGSCHFEVPILEASANSGGGRRRGILRGLIEIFQSTRDGRTLSAHYDPSTRRLDIENADIRFSGRRIVIPALVNASREEPGSPPQITGGDLDGRFRGHWTMDTETGRGRGRLCVVGDSSDIALRGADGRVLPDPLVSDTRWCATSITRADTRRQILWGNFFLDTTFDWGLLRYFGIHLNMRERGRMAHDNFPYSARGYESIERLFFRRVQRESLDPSVGERE